MLNFFLSIGSQRNLQRYNVRVIVDEVVGGVNGERRMRGGFCWQEREALVSSYFVCLCTLCVLQDVHRGVPQAGQDSVENVMPLALHWH